MAPNCWWPQLQAPLKLPSLAPSPNLDNPSPQHTREVLLLCAVSRHFWICSASTPIYLQCPAWDALPPARYGAPQSSLERPCPLNSLRTASSHVLFPMVACPDYPLPLDYRPSCPSTSPELPLTVVCLLSVCVHIKKSVPPTRSALQAHTHGTRVETRQGKLSDSQHVLKEWLPALSSLTYDVCAETQPTARLSGPRRLPPSLMT